MSKAQQPKGMVEKRMSGWRKSRDASVAARRHKYGSLEVDIEAYNEKIRKQGEAARKFGQTRLRVDRYHQKRRDEEELLEVWDEGRRHGRKGPR